MQASTKYTSMAIKTAMQPTTLQSAIMIEVSISNRTLVRDVQKTRKSKTSKIIKVITDRREMITTRQEIHRMPALIIIKHEAIPNRNNINPDTSNQIRTKGATSNSMVTKVTLNNNRTTSSSQVIKAIKTTATNSTNSTTIQHPSSFNHSSITVCRPIRMNP